jgi:hypothetical protein
MYSWGTSLRLCSEKGVEEEKKEKHTKNKKQKTKSQEAR